MKVPYTQNNTSSVVLSLIIFGRRTTCRISPNLQRTKLCFFDLRIRVYGFEMQYSEEAQRCDQGEAYIASDVPVSACSRSPQERIECSMLRKSQSKNYFQSNQYSLEVQLAYGLTIRKATLLKMSFGVVLCQRKNFGSNHNGLQQLFVHLPVIFCLHKSPSLDAGILYQQAALYIAIHEFWALKLFSNSMFVKWLP